jgi:hypothetical protein
MVRGQCSLFADFPVLATAGGKSILDRYNPAPPPIFFGTYCVHSSLQSTGGQRPIIRQLFSFGRNWGRGGGPVMLASCDLLDTQITLAVAKTRGFSLILQTKSYL